MTTAVVENEVAATEVAEDILDGVDLGEETSAAPADEVADATTTEEQATASGEEIQLDGQSAETVSGVAEGEQPATASPEPAAPLSEVDGLRQQLARLQAVVEELKYADADIVAQAARVRELGKEVQTWESTAKEAKAELSAAKERYASAGRELRSMIDDRAKGQRRLRLLEAGAVNGVASDPVKKILETAADKINAGDLNTGELTAAAEVSPAKNEPAAPDEHASDPISVLGQKDMIKLAGQDAWETAKNRDEPFGMAVGELAILEENELTTIGKLEKRMREEPNWYRDIKKFGEKKVAKLIESLRVFRGKYPQPAE